ncbi:hypothetical protein FALBO_815 [Fusarium albosuccineum]|uniref:Uncharacterized protein n=1 Tax=Fusarium albosuccineum TaxID=1237068 RepID=A0A8H4LP58_9HYPO|nr:hypothetical protein FALBO_815 [Fusarium albosuccineum]
MTKPQVYNKPLPLRLAAKPNHSLSILPSHAVDKILLNAQCPVPACLKKWRGRSVQRPTTTSKTASVASIFIFIDDVVVQNGQYMRPRPRHSALDIVEPGLFARSVASPWHSHRDWNRPIKYAHVRDLLLGLARVRIASLVRLARWVPHLRLCPCLGLRRLDLGAATRADRDGTAAATAVSAAANPHHNAALPIATAHLGLPCCSVLDYAAPVWRITAATVSVRFIQSSPFRLSRPQDSLASP